MRREPGTGDRVTSPSFPGHAPGRTCHDLPVTDTVVLPPDLATPADGPPLASWSRRVVAALLDGAILGRRDVARARVRRPRAVADADVRREPDGRRRPGRVVHQPVARRAPCSRCSRCRAGPARRPGKRVAGRRDRAALRRAAGGGARLGPAGGRAPARRDPPHRVPAAPLERAQADVRRLDRRHPGRPDARAARAPVVRPAPARAVGARLDGGHRRRAGRVRARRRLLDGVELVGRLVGDAGALRRRPDPGAPDRLRGRRPHRRQHAREPAVGQPGDRRGRRQGPAHHVDVDLSGRASGDALFETDAGRGPTGRRSRSRRRRC